MCAIWRSLAVVVLTLSWAVAPVTASAQSYGAIAYAPANGHWGWWRNAGTRRGAETGALRECQNAGGGRNCRVALWFSNACGALAVGPNGWGTGWGSTVTRAHAEALQVCQRHSRGCRIRMDVCSPS